MSISGSGTQASPYIVSSLEDLQALPDLVNGGQLEEYYAELAADIDGRFNQAWQTFRITSRNPLYFDLKGHAIKNFIISRPSVNSVITLIANVNHTIKNGKILNFKTDNTVAYEQQYSPFTGGVYENMSMSFYFPRNYDSYMFSSLRKLDRCAINVLIDDYSYGSSGSVFSFYPLASDDNEFRVNNCDFKIIIRNIIDAGTYGTRTVRLFTDYSVPSGAVATKMKNCRLQGEISKLENSNLNAYPKITENIELNNCVVSFGLPEYTGSGNVADSWTIPATSTGIVNEDLVDDFQTYMVPTAANMPRLSDTEIRSYSDLVAAGFDVERG